MMHGIHDAWFLRYRARQEQFFVILEYSLHFYPLNNPENQNFEKNPWRYHHFTHVYHKSKSYDVWFLRYRAQQV